MLMWGNEDTDLIGVGAAVVDQTAGRFDPDVDSGLAVPPPLFPFSLASFWRSVGQFGATIFSVSARVWSNAVGNIGGNTGSRFQAFLLRLLDIDGIPRLAIISQHDSSSGNPNLGGPWIVVKIDAAGNFTTIGSSAGFVGPAASEPVTLHTSADTPSGSTLPFTSTVGVFDDAIVTGTNIAGGTTVSSFVEDVSVTLSAPILGDVANNAAIVFFSNRISTFTVSVNYSVSGGVKVYVDGALMFAFSGDVTTDGVASLAGLDLGEPVLPSLSPSGTTVWSKVILNNTPTQSLNMIKMTINGTGAISDWNGDPTGATVNEIVLNDADGIDAPTSPLTELFTQSFSFPAGSWQIVGVGLNAYASASPLAIVYDTSGDTPSGDTLPFTSTTGIVAGQSMTGAGIASGAIVLSIVPNTSVTMTLNVLSDVPAATPISFFGPQNIDLVLRIGGVDYAASNSLGPVLDASLGRQAYFWPTSPATGVAFTPTELAGTQIGAKSLP